MFNRVGIMGVLYQNCSVVINDKIYKIDYIYTDSYVSKPVY